MKRAEDDADTREAALLVAAEVYLSLMMFFEVVPRDLNRVTEVKGLIP